MTIGDDARISPDMEAVAVKDTARKILEEAEADSSGSSEAETESPRSVGRWGDSSAAAKERVHSQVLRVREQELCVLLEDKATNYCSDREDHRYIHPRRLNLFLVSRPILPCSPLSGKVTSLKAVQ
ncbi:PREDICTED: uncharacterized protein LOC104822523 [Tarenaya hassleriana]|uniref:uncharacterized protein LOC104822523 n=1 Tax=Tarenaya hassleriana TaxID=28532 RepID=UPI00053C716B|nr:PREDICTED: uncharacterized protein LOC104822523 [Tarenaya hassleriana]